MVSANGQVGSNNDITGFTWRALYLESLGGQGFSFISNQCCDELMNDAFRLDNTKNSISGHSQSDTTSRGYIAKPQMSSKSIQQSVTAAATSLHHHSQILQNWFYIVLKSGSMHQPHLVQKLDFGNLQFDPQIFCIESLKNEKYESLSWHTGLFTYTMYS